MSLEFIKGMSNITDQINSVKINNIFTRWFELSNQIEALTRIWLDSSQIQKRVKLIQFECNLMTIIMDVAITYYISHAFFSFYFRRLTWVSEVASARNCANGYVSSKILNMLRRCHGFGLKLSTSVIVKAIVHVVYLFDFMSGHKDFVMIYPLWILQPLFLFLLIQLL